MDLKSATNFVRRRRLLGLLAGGVFFRNVHAATPACVEAPRQTEGPYFLDHRLERSDIRKETDGTVSAGVPLHFKIGVRAADSGCEPMSNLIVDVWHCNAQGVYSGVRDPRFGRVGTHFLRGYQVTDENGEVRFDTIYPGWYPGRAVHIHVKLIWPRGSAQGSVREWSSQLTLTTILRTGSMRVRLMPGRAGAANAMKTMRYSGMAGKTWYWIWRLREKATSDVLI